MSNYGFGNIYNLFKTAILIFLGLILNSVTHASELEKHTGLAKSSCGKVSAPPAERQSNDPSFPAAAIINNEGNKAQLCGAISKDIINQGELDLLSGTTLSGRVTNHSSASIRLRNGQYRVTEHLTNHGVIDILYSDVVFENGLTNYGALLFDPSTITISTLIVGPNGYLAETGDPGDRFIITEDLINQSTQNILWNTPNTIFQFNGGFHDATNPQSLEAAAADIGNIQTGWSNNFVLGTLEVGTSATYVKLLDNHNNSATSLGGFPEIGSNEALYVNNLILRAGVTLDLNNLSLYVRNTFTDSGATILNGAILFSSEHDGDINEDGNVNIADALLATQFVLGLATPTAAQLLHGDVGPIVAGSQIPDGKITAIDINLIDRKILGLAGF